METYLILGAIFSFVISLFTNLRLGKLLRIYFLKKIYPEMTINELTQFEEKTKPKYFWNQRINRET